MIEKNQYTGCFQEKTKMIKAPERVDIHDDNGLFCSNMRIKQEMAEELRSMGLSESKIIKQLNLISP